MIEHIIVIGSSYLLGKRIAWHYAGEEIKKEVLTELQDKTKSILGHADYSIHKLTTGSENWDSVVNKDSFFEDFEVYADIDAFLQIISEDKKVSALDIAKLLLSVKPMSNLKLQKMVYLTYADYLTKTKKKLFEDKIKAYQYGPVVEEVYNYYKENGRETIKEDETLITLDEITVPLALAKILQSDDYESILDSVTRTFEKFGSKTASQLVSITHKDGSPWSKTPGFYGEITDDYILSCHEIEIS